MHMIRVRGMLGQNIEGKAEQAINKYRWMLPAILLTVPIGPITGYTNTELAIFPGPGEGKSVITREQQGEGREETTTGIWYSTGPSTSAIHTLVIDPQNPDIIYAGGSSLYKSEDRGESWITLDWIGEQNRNYNRELNELWGEGIYFGSVGALLATAETPSVLYVSASGTRMLVKSIDRGHQWLNVFKPYYDDRERFPDANSIRAMAVDAHNPTIIYAAYNYGWGMSRSIDGGKSWSNFGCESTGSGSLDAPYYDCSYRVLTPDPHSPETLYAAGWDPITFYATPEISGEEGIFRRAQGDSALTAILSAEQVSALAVDAHEPGTIYAGSRVGRFYRSTDGGETWNTAIPFAKINALVTDPHRPDVLYLGSKRGVFISDDSGETWQPLGEGLKFEVTAMALDTRQPSTLYASTGSSVYRLLVSPASTTVQEDRLTNPLRVQLEQNYPNPFNGSTQINYRITATGRVRLAIFDMLGQRVKLLVDAVQSAGVYQTLWDGTDQGHKSLATGLYFAQLRTNETIQLKKMVLVK